MRRTLIISGVMLLMLVSSVMIAQAFSQMDYAEDTQSALMLTGGFTGTSTPFRIYPTSTGSFNNQQNIVPTASRPDVVINIGDEFRDFAEAGGSGVGYVFSAFAGQIIYVDLRANGGRLETRLDYLLPRGGYNVVTELENNVPVFVMPQSGEYRLNVFAIAGREDLGSRVDYTLHLYEPPETVISYGQPLTDSLDPATQVNVFRFSASLGDVIHTNVQASAFSPILHLLRENPDGTRQQMTSSITRENRQRPGSASINLETLPADGDYLLLILSAQSQGSMLDYRLMVERVQVSGPLAPTVLSAGDSIDGTFTAEKVQDTYPINVSYGDVVTVSAESDTIDTLLYMYRLFDGEQFRLRVDDDSGQGFNPEIASFLVTQPGQYIVQLIPFTSGTTGDYTLSLQASNHLSLPEGQPQQIQLDKTHQEYRVFAAEAGERIRLTTLGAEGGITPDVKVLHFDPVTQREQQLVHLVSIGLPEMSFEFVVPQTGNLLVLVENPNTVQLPINGMLTLELERVTAEATEEASETEG